MPQSAEHVPVRLRQIALVSNDLRKAESDLCYILGTEVIFRDPLVAQWGLENFLVPLGGDIIEVVAPIRAGTTAGRLLSKRGPGGYIVIMQTAAAAARKEHIVTNKLGAVIWEHETIDSHAVQYHPKSVRGGVMTELDSMKATESNRRPLEEPFSPWHACGSNYAKYSAGMKRHADLSLIGCTLRLPPGDLDVEGTATQWEQVFGIARSRNLLLFTNGRLDFEPGKDSQAEGLVSITIEVRGQARLNKIMERADERGLAKEGVIEMLGLHWFFRVVGEKSEARL